MFLGERPDRWFAPQVYISRCMSGNIHKKTLFFFSKKPRFEIYTSRRDSQFNDIRFRPFGTEMGAILSHDGVQFKRQFTIHAITPQKI